MRKNLKVVPVYAANATPLDPPIDEISPKEADELVDAGVAISLKGRAIRLRRGAVLRAGSLECKKSLIETFDWVGRGMSRGAQEPTTCNGEFLSGIR
jgi:hypothetical protein